MHHMCSNDKILSKNPFNVVPTVVKITALKMASLCQQTETNFFSITYCQVICLKQEKKNVIDKTNDLKFMMLPSKS